jgi:hypothetical protein
MINLDYKLNQQGGNDNNITNIIRRCNNNLEAQQRYFLNKQFRASHPIDDFLSSNENEANSLSLNMDRIKKKWRKNILMVSIF